MNPAMTIERRKLQRACVSLTAAVVAVLPALGAATASTAADTGGGSAAALRDLYASSAQRLRDSPFHRPLYLTSDDTSGKLKGEVFAELDHPFAEVRDSLSAPENWCDALLLTPNVAQCTVSGSSPPMLKLNFARKFDQSLNDTFAATFAFKPEQATQDYLEARLEADKGPMGTSDYHFLVEAVPVAGNKTFLHFVYSYSYGLAARMATDAYLETKGADKVGFTTRGTSADGKPEYIGGLRGAVERNAMRYELAFDAYLSALRTPATQRFDESLHRWLDAVAQYPQQLKEDDPSAYVATKRSEYQRQHGNGAQAGPADMDSRGAAVASLISRSG